MGIGPGTGLEGFVQGAQQGYDWDQQRKLKAAELQRQQSYASEAARENWNAQNEMQDAYSTYDKSAAGQGQTPYGQIPNFSVQDPVRASLQKLFGGVKRAFGGSQATSQGHAGGPVDKDTTTQRATGNAAPSAPQPTTAGEATSQGQQPTSAVPTSQVGPQPGVGASRQLPPPDQQGQGWLANGGTVGRPTGMFPATGIKPRKARPHNTEPSPSMQGGTDQGGPTFADGNQVQEEQAPGEQGGGLGDLASAAGRGIANAWSQNAGPARAMPGRLPGNPNTPPNGVDQATDAALQRSPGVPGGTQPATPAAATSAAPAASTRAGKTAAESAAPPASPVPPRGAKPAAGGGAGAAPNVPYDFSKTDIDHNQIPNTSAEDWEQIKAQSVRHLMAHGMPAAQATITTNEQISGYQQNEFLQYMKQGQALLQGGNQKGAMAAMRMAYQYMPTGHDVTFGVDQNSGNIIGFGVDEKTGAPVGKAIVLDQRGINDILTQFSDPREFQKNMEGYQLIVQRAQMAPYQRGMAQANIGLAQGRASYFGNRNQTALDVQGMRNQSMAARQLLDHIAPDLRKNLEQQISNPQDQGEALQVAAQMMQKYSSGDPRRAQAIQQDIFGAVQSLYSYPPGQAREQAARRLGIQLPSSGQQDPNMEYMQRSDAMYGGGAESEPGSYNLPPRQR